MRCPPSNPCLAAGQVHCGFRGTVVDEQGNPMYASVRVANIDHVTYTAIATGATLLN